MTDIAREQLEAQLAANTLLAGILRAADVIGIFSVAISFVLALLLGVTCGK